MATAKASIARATAIPKVVIICMAGFLFIGDEVMD
jgi:hypothetical protein